MTTPPSEKPPKPPETLITNATQKKLMLVEEGDEYFYFDELNGTLYKRTPRENDSGYRLDMLPHPLNEALQEFHHNLLNTAQLSQEQEHDFIKDMHLDELALEFPYTHDHPQPGLCVILAGTTYSRRAFNIAIHRADEETFEKYADFVRNLNRKI